MPRLASRVSSVELPLGQDHESEWRPHRLFRGSTPDIALMECHVSVLDPGHGPHPPHRHDEEELLVVLGGEANLLWGDEATERHSAGRGTFAFYPRGVPHTIENASDDPVTYLTFNWVADSGERRGALETRLVPALDAYAEGPHDHSSGYKAKPVLNGATRYLRHLHAHVTNLQPGAGLAPHVDAYDVGIVVLEGTVEALGEQVGPNGVIYCPAGEPHGMLGTGHRPAVYLVFEFHGRHSTRYARPRRRLRRLRRPLAR